MTKYVVISVNENPEYIFYLPLVVWAWRKFGWEPIIFSPSNMAEHPTRLLWTGFRFIDDAQYLNLHHFNVPGYGTDTAAQVSRLYAACPYGPDNDYIMTSDVDMLPLSDYWKFDPEKITVWGHDLTGFQHMPICYIGMKRTRWVEVMALTSHRYNELMKRDLDRMPNAKSQDSVKRWVVDQDLITERVNAVNFPKEFVPRGSGSNGYPLGRVDRSAWSLCHNRFIDCHMERGIWKDQAKQGRLKDLLAAMWPDDNFQWWNEYVIEFERDAV